MIDEVWRKKIHDLYVDTLTLGYELDDHCVKRGAIVREMSELYKVVFPEAFECPNGDGYGVCDCPRPAEPQSGPKGSNV